jgi:hypothetical protein
MNSSGPVRIHGTAEPLSGSGKPPPKQAISTGAPGAATTAWAVRCT